MGNTTEFFPDGTVISEWYYDTTIPSLKDLGPGTIDGNGLRSWQSFWLRRKWNRMCTNKDEQRPRLVYITNSKKLLFANVTLQNSHYWTTHLLRIFRMSRGKSFLKKGI